MNNRRKYKAGLLKKVWEAASRFYLNKKSNIKNKKLWSPPAAEAVLKKVVKNNGFTLAEAMIAIVILTIAAAALILPFASSAAVEEQGIKQTIAAKLAGDLVEQILADPNSFSQAAVAYYDNYAESKGQIKDANGIVFSGQLYADLSRNADCNYVYMPQQSNFGTPNFLKITVRVYQNNLKLAEITRLKAK